MRFYHSFPRRPNAHTGEWAHDQIGLDILAGIMKHGLLLTSEILTIPANPASDVPNPPTTSVTQHRACFTLIELHELLRAGGHGSYFGDFAIGLDTKRARRLGILPAFYYYPATGHCIDGGLSQEFLFRMAEIRRVLIALARVEARGRARNARSEQYLDRFRYDLVGEPRVERRLSGLSTPCAEQIFRVFDTERLPACDLVEWVELFLSVFQTADSAHRDRHLAYYAQREWRLIQLYSPSITVLPLGGMDMAQLTGDMAAIALGASRFVNSFRERHEMSPEFAETFLLAGLREWRDDGRESDFIPFSSFVEEVVVPIDASRDAEDTVDELSSEFSKEEFARHVVYRRRGSR